MKKIIILGIIIMLGLTTVPNINAQIKTTQAKTKLISDHTLDSNNPDLITLYVTEYSSDGTLEKTTVTLPYDKFLQMRTKLKNTHNIDDRLAIYKKHDLIPENVTAEHLQNGMKAKAKRLGITADQVQNIAHTIRPNKPGLNDCGIVINAMCQVRGYACLGLRFYGGTSWFISYINALLDGSPLLPSIDLVNFGLSLGSIDTINGLFPNNGEVFWGMAYFIAGFVGYIISLVPVPIVRTIVGWEDFLGFSAFVFAAGPSYWLPRM